MASTFSWLDYSDSERRRMLDVARSLNERNTRDELGLATVRDALSDQLAPGISTIQTRARYFLFIPWIYQEIEARLRQRAAGVTKEWVTRKARNEEVGLIPHLLQSDDAVGTIGSSAGKSVQRLPSSVYWNGLAEWGIRLCPWAIDTYHHRLAAHGPTVLKDAHDTWGTGSNWHPGLPDMPEGFPNGVSMTLQPLEAQYLRERILETHPDSLLGQLVMTGESASDLRYPWQVLDFDVELPPSVVNLVRHARNFSLAMHGAVLVYNLLLAETVQMPRQDWVDRYRRLIAEWAEEVEAHSFAFVDWDRADFWRTVERMRPRVPPQSRSFIDAWLDRFLTTEAPGTLANDPAIHRLIDKRECQLKKRQARLHDPRLLEKWNGDSGSGVGRMDFRWPAMRGHLVDILSSLEGGMGADHAGAG